DPIISIRCSNYSVALWWAVFSLPLMLYVPEPAATAQQDCLWAGIKSSLSELRHTLIHMRQMRPVWLFLLAYWLYIDGVNTVIRMAVDYGAALGFSNNDLIAALLLTQFIGFPATIAFGWLGQRLGAKNGIFVAIAVYLIIILWASQMQQVYEFYALAVAIALVQGGIQALSRSYYSRLIPLQRTAEFYGFYNMLGKFAAVLGPVMMGAAAFMLGDSRYSILVLAVFFVLGGWLLSKVNEPTQKNKH
ncbi:MAG: MFS transporter, partial [gamma proteobacterium symbiont of Bathyaustriella thionipta]|nr:MFS transporter [gamma proteobacterium symbiont of Bathyaustriella thionipta]